MWLQERVLGVLGEWPEMLRALALANKKLRECLRASRQDTASNSFRTCRSSTLQFSDGSWRGIQTRLLIDPFKSGRKLVGKTGPGRWRFRMGDYRMQFDVEGGVLIFYRVRHRREIYD